MIIYKVSTMNNMIACNRAMKMYQFIDELVLNMILFKINNG